MASKIDKKVKQQEKQDSSRVWSMMSLVSGLTAALVAKKVLDGSWRAATGKTPPANPADPDVDIWEAVVWATVSGTADRRRPDAGRPPGRQLLHAVHRPPAARAPVRRLQGGPGRGRGRPGAGRAAAEAAGKKGRRARRKAGV